MSNTLGLGNATLAPYTTFKIGGPARYFVECATISELKQAIAFAKEKGSPFFVLGGGSNVLVSDEGYDGMVIHMVTKGVETKVDGILVSVTAAAGEVWDDIVAYAVDQGFWGIENLSHIPGLVGATAVQNIGAYGQEVENVITEVEVFDTKTNQVDVLSNEACKFGYRSSIFNTTEKGRYIILQTTFQLTLIARPCLTYPDLQKEFGAAPASVGAGLKPAARGTLDTVTLENIRQAIIKIRDKKFPFPKEAVNGNAGSFFKNVFLSEQEYSSVHAKVAETLGEDAADKLEVIKNKFPSGDRIKIPTAFLFEVCGVKELTSGGAAINQNQPLVILNHTGTATANDVLSLFKKARQKVYTATGLKLQNEPVLVGFSDEELKEYFEVV